jgi:hypothetical protein
MCVSTSICMRALRHTNGRHGWGLRGRKEGRRMPSQPYRIAFQFQQLGSNMFEPPPYSNARSSHGHTVQRKEQAGVSNDTIETKSINTQTSTSSSTKECTPGSSEAITVTESNITVSTKSTTADPVEDPLPPVGQRIEVYWPLDKCHYQVSCMRGSVSCLHAYFTWQWCLVFSLRLLLYSIWITDSKCDCNTSMTIKRK